MEDYGNSGNLRYQQRKVHLINTLEQSIHNFPIQNNNNEKFPFTLPSLRGSAYIYNCPCSDYILEKYPARARCSCLNILKLKIQFSNRFYLIPQTIKAKCYRFFLSTLAFLQIILLSYLDNFFSIVILKMILIFNSHTFLLHSSNFLKDTHTREQSYFFNSHTLTNVL